MGNIAIIFAFALALVPPQFGGEDKKGQTAASQSLQYEIVVTATRIETPARELASSVTVIQFCSARSASAARAAKVAALRSPSASA